MLLGLDFDNTIVNYKDAIQSLARDIFELPSDLVLTKIGLRDYLRSQGKENEWVRFQGLLYGPGMKYAKPYENSVSAMQRMQSLGHKLIIISHRTRYPYSGDRFDLHQYARDWVFENLLAVENLTEFPIFFFETKPEKIKKISDTNCDIFLDDLTSIIQDKSFPLTTKGILFSPDGPLDYSGDYITNWIDLERAINCEA